MQDVSNAFGFTSLAYLGWRETIEMSQIPQNLQRVCGRLSEFLHFFGQ